MLRQLRFNKATLQLKKYSAKLIILYYTQTEREIGNMAQYTEHVHT